MLQERVWLLGRCGNPGNDPSRPPFDPAQAFQAAVRAFNARDWTQAESLCGQVLAHDPRHVDAFHMLGLVWSEMGRAEAAIELLQKTVQFQPHNALVWTNLGIVYRKSGQDPWAVDCLRTAIGLRNDIPEAHFNLSLACKACGMGF
jgi:Tfp pilus assembly protein PilF